MLTKEQKEFRRQMKEIKKEKGELYYEIYDEEPRPRGWERARSINVNMLIRMGLFAMLVMSRINPSGILTSMIKGQDAQSDSWAIKPAFVNRVHPQLIGTSQQSCSDYLQGVLVINQDLSQLMGQYSQGQISLEGAKEQIHRLGEDLDELGLLEHTEALRGLVEEGLQKSLELIEISEYLKITRVVNTEEERIFWEKKQASAKALNHQLQEIGTRHQEAVKALLDQYDMRYVENQDGGIEYHYTSNIYGK